MNCIYEDNNAGFLDSFSYCQAIDVCLENAWNYIDYKCASTWTRGNTIDLDICGPRETTCPEFISSANAYGVYTNTTQALASGEVCSIFVDATQAVARIIFDNTNNLGIEEVNGYIYGSPISIDAGGFQTFNVYNADSSGGSITFTLSFSWSRTLVANLLTVSGLALLFWQ